MSADKRKFESRAIPVLKQIREAGEHGFSVNIKHRPTLDGYRDGILQKLLDKGLLRRTRRMYSGRGVRLKSFSFYNKEPSSRTVVKRGKRYKIETIKIVKTVSTKEHLKKSGKNVTVLFLTAKGEKLLTDGNGRKL